MEPRESISKQSAQARLSELLTRYLHRQVRAQESGLAIADSPGEVVLFDAAPAQVIEPRVAWEGATAALHYLRNDAATKSLQAPPDWSTLVTRQESAFAVAFACGNYPQLVSNFHALLSPTNATALRPTGGAPAALATSQEWIDQLTEKGEFPQLLLGLGVLRLARQYEQAAELLQRWETQVPSAWRAAWTNERAALAWHAGRTQEAAELWEAQEESVPVLFNRGMAALFLDKPAAARTLLGQALFRLTEEEPWYHLGCLYQALAQMRE
jgi:tetratricopeptide (TPR) repeat protein